MWEKPQKEKENQNHTKIGAKEKMKGRSRERKVKKEREARSILEEDIIRGRVSVQNSSSSSFSLCPTLMFKSSCKYSSV